MTIKLESGSSFLNPYMLEVKDGDWREVKEIRIFNERGVAHKLRWFTDGSISKGTPVEFKGLKLVRKAKEYIRKGDIFQVNLSQRFSAPQFLPPFSLLIFDFI